MMSFFGKYLESLDYDYEILPSCTRLQSPHSKCEECVKSCDLEAIKIVNGMPIINHENCSECGNCIISCPVQAVAGIYPYRMVLGDQLIITDKRIPTKKELLVLYGKGIKTIVYDNPSFLEFWKEPIEKANSDLRELGEKPFLISINLTTQREAYSRRDLFNFWKKESKSVLKMAAPAKWRFNHDDFNVKKHYTDYLFTSIVIDTEKCSVCTACQRLCKEKCFQFEKEQIIISPESCTSCYLCSDICPDDAITLEERITKKPLKINHPIFINTCSVCDNTFDTLDMENNKCDICKKRELYIKE